MADESAFVAHGGRVWLPLLVGVQAGVVVDVASSRRAIAPGRVSSVAVLNAKQVERRTVRIVLMCMVRVGYMCRMLFTIS